ncbi:MAG: glycosyltransferase family 2 protein [Bacteroidota bacterium]
MKISVLIATRNRSSDLRTTLRQYQKQTFKNMEIVVVDNASTDGTAEMIRAEFPGIVFLKLPDNIVHLALNLGIELSSGDIIWRSDDDSYPETDDTFERVAEIFQKFPHIAIIGGEIINVAKGEKAFAHWHPLTGKNVEMPEDGFPSHSFMGCGAAIRREVFKSIGGFWDAFFYEELDFTARAVLKGFTAKYFPTIRSLHFPSVSARPTDDRWVYSSTHYLRYQWRYFPFWTAFGRTMIYWFHQLFIGILRRVKPSSFFEAAFGMIAISFATFRNERNVAPPGMIERLTLGESFIGGIGRSFKETGARFLKRVFKRK